MSDNVAGLLNDALQQQRALSRWDNEGGAEPDGPQTALAEVNGQPSFPKMGDAEFAALHVRVIALENLVISLLAAAPDQERKRATQMASYISPRPGFTRHPLTLHAGAHMVRLVERARRFLQLQPSS